MNDLLKNELPAGCLVVNNESGWMDSEQFILWLSHFHVNVTSTKEKPILLNGHAWRPLNLHVTVESTCFHSHAPHTTQTRCSHLTEFSTTLSYPTTIKLQTKTLYQVGELFCEAYVKSVTMTNALSGFSAYRIWPCNRDICVHNDFVVSDRFNEHDELPQGKP